jgi:hypothetical protein
MRVNNITLFATFEPNCRLIGLSLAFNHYYMHQSVETLKISLITTPRNIIKHSRFRPDTRLTQKFAIHLNGHQKRKISYSLEPLIESIELSRWKFSEWILKWEWELKWDNIMSNAILKIYPAPNWHLCHAKVLRCVGLKDWFKKRISLIESNG